MNIMTLARSLWLSPRGRNFEENTRLGWFETEHSLFFLRRDTPSAMLYLIGCLFLLLSSRISGVPIPFVSNAFLQSRYRFNFTIVANQSVDQCLCLSLPSFVAFNWFPNHTCQLFRAFPVTYKIQSMAQAQLYFPQRVFPNASQCCMPDLVYLFEQTEECTVEIGQMSRLRAT